MASDQATNIYLSKNFLLGVFIIHFAVLGYNPTVNLFSYGGGWPFVQIIFLIIYLVGVRFMFKSKVPLTVKLILSLWWIAWAMTSEDLWLSA